MRQVPTGTRLRSGTTGVVLTGPALQLSSARRPSHWYLARAYAEGLAGLIKIRLVPVAWQCHLDFESCRLFVSKPL